MGRTYISGNSNNVVTIVTNTVTTNNDIITTTSSTIILLQVNNLRGYGVCERGVVLRRGRNLKPDKGVFQGYRNKVTAILQRPQYK